LGSIKVNFLQTLIKNIRKKKSIIPNTPPSPPLDLELLSPSLDSSLGAASSSNEIGSGAAEE
jgi:hypothetical protein